MQPNSLDPRPGVRLVPVLPGSIGWPPERRGNVAGHRSRTWCAVRRHPPRAREDPMSDRKTYLDREQPRFVEAFLVFCRIPSISSLPEPEARARGVRAASPRARGSGLTRTPRRGAATGRGAAPHRNRRRGRRGWRSSGPRRARSGVGLLSGARASRVGWPSALVGSRRRVPGGPRSPLAYVAGAR